MKTDLTAPHFTNEEAARAHYEAIRWPDGPHCHFCGSLNVVRMEGKSHRPGLFNCRDCRKPFTATMGTIYEKSKIPLHKWLLATHIMCASKKGVSAHQLWRMLGFGSYKTAWFMAHRIREAMKSDTGGMFGSGGGEVEVDETFIGRKAGEPIYHGHEHKMAVMTLIDRDSGAARSMVIPGRLRLDTLKPMLDANIAKEARIRTDEARHYMKLGNTFAEHKSVNHSAGEYVSREDRSVHTNRVEGYYSVFKRGMRGVYQHCAEHHLHRYMHEFDFRYSNRSALGIEDNERAEKAVKGTVGRRLTYHPPRAKAATA